MGHGAARLLQLMFGVGQTHKGCAKYELFSDRATVYLTENCLTGSE